VSKKNQTLQQLLLLQPMTLSSSVDVECVLLTEADVLGVGIIDLTQAEEGGE
jgi:hypothetical protein